MKNNIILLEQVIGDLKHLRVLTSLNNVNDIYVYDTSPDLYEH